jgi:hypothetical protein
VLNHDWRDFKDCSEFIHNYAIIHIFRGSVHLDNANNVHRNEINDGIKLINSVNTCYYLGTIILFTFQNITVSE